LIVNPLFFTSSVNTVFPEARELFLLAVGGRYGNLLYGNCYKEFRALSTFRATATDD